MTFIHCLTILLYIKLPKVRPCVVLISCPLISDQDLCVAWLVSKHTSKIHDTCLLSQNRCNQSKINIVTPAYLSKDLFSLFKQKRSGKPVISMFKLILWDLFTSWERRGGAWHSRLLHIAATYLRDLDHGWCLHICQLLDASLSSNNIANLKHPQKEI